MKISTAAERVRDLEQQLNEARIELDQAVTAAGWKLMFSHVDTTGRRTQEIWTRTNRRGDVETVNSLEALLTA